MTIHALALADVMTHDERQTCDWPDCEDLSDSHRFCRKHWLRIERGAEPGVESEWERLVVAALRLAGAEFDELAAAEGAAQARGREVPPRTEEEGITMTTVLVGLAVWSGLGVGFAAGWAFRSIVGQEIQPAPEPETPSGPEREPAPDDEPEVHHAA